MDRIELNKTTEWILGRPNFWCGPIARVMRLDGRTIRKHAEEEQAAVIHWLLNLYLEHGPDEYLKVAGAELNAMGPGAEAKVPLVVPGNSGD